jgi:glycosyltransferase involved in cell wall biosynthesis
MSNKVSIIIPCYNQGRYLDETLQSVLEQTHSDWECIVVNDGSTDNTEQVVSTRMKQDSRFKYIKKENEGPSIARNRGLEVAQGDFIQFLDADDLLVKNKFETQLQYVSEKKVDIVVCGYNYLINDTVFNSNEYSNRFPECTVNGFIYGWDTRFVIVIHSPLISRDFLTKHQIRFCENLEAKEDWFFWVTCALHGASFYYSPEILVHYRRHDRNITRDNSSIISANYKAILYLYDLLNQEQKITYKEKMPNVLLKKTISYYGNDIRNSYNYRLGRWMLQPVRYIVKLLHLR